MRYWEWYFDILHWSEHVLLLLWVYLLILYTANHACEMSSLKERRNKTKWEKMNKLSKTDDEVWYNSSIDFLEMEIEL